MRAPASRMRRPASRPVTEEPAECRKAGVGHMVFDALCVLFRRLGGNADGNQQIHDQPMARRYPLRQPLACLAAIGFRNRQPLTLQPADRLDCSGVRYAEASGDVGGARFAAVGQQVGTPQQVMPVVDPSTRGVALAPRGADAEERYEDHLRLDRRCTAAGAVKR
jgi:hypothetical protein